MDLHKRYKYGDWVSVFLIRVMYFIVSGTTHSDILESGLLIFHLLLIARFPLVLFIGIIRT